MARLFAAAAPTADYRHDLAKGMRAWRRVRGLQLRHPSAAQCMDTTGRSARVRNTDPCFPVPALPQGITTLLATNASSAALALERRDGLQQNELWVHYPDVPEFNATPKPSDPRAAMAPALAARHLGTGGSWRWLISGDVRAPSGLQGALMLVCLLRRGRAGALPPSVLPSAALNPFGRPFAAAGRYRIFLARAVEDAGGAGPSGSLLPYRWAQLRTHGCSLWAEEVKGGRTDVPLAASADNFYARWPFTKTGQGRLDQPRCLPCTFNDAGEGVGTRAEGTFTSIICWLSSCSYHLQPAGIDLAATHAFKAPSCNCSVAAMAEHFSKLLKGAGLGFPRRPPVAASL